MTMQKKFKAIKKYLQELQQKEQSFLQDGGIAFGFFQLQSQECSNEDAQLNLQFYRICYWSPPIWHW